MALNREGALQLPVEFTLDGEYLLRVRAFGQQAGPEPAKMELHLDGQTLQVVDVEAEEASPEVYTLRFTARSGDRQLALSYINNYRNPSDPDPNNRDRNLIIETIELVGPLGQPLPQSHTRIFSQDSTPDTRATTARTLVGQFAERAWRRPLTARELDRLVDLFERVDAPSDSFIASVKVVLEAVLVSPQFLFRGELQPEPDNPASVYPIDQFALASRLSYFLWSSMPDEALFEEARQGTLRLNLTGEVLRMLRDPKSQALVENFAGQWLQIRNLRLVAPDPGTFPDFDETLRSAMVHETERFFDYVMREDRSVLEFLEADYTFVNGRLARHYGLPDIEGEVFQRVALDGTHRGGVLTHGSVLTLTSNPTRTSPVKRGKWVLENLLGSAPPPPPPDVPELSEEKTAVLSGTLRQRMEQHRADPNCATCHERMDPIGFGMENFDGIGAWRLQDGDFPIDPAGRLSSGQSFSGIDELRVLLVQEKRDAFLDCLAERMLTYALGRGVEYYDACALERIREGLAREDYRFSALILEIVRSVPFQMRRGEGDRTDLVAQAPHP